MRDIILAVLFNQTTNRWLDSQREMLAGCDDGIGQSLLSILTPSSGVYMNRDMIRNLFATISQIAEETAKAISAQQ